MTLPARKSIYLVMLPALLLFFRGAADATVTLTAMAFLWHAWRRRDWSWLGHAWMQLALLTCAYLLLVSTPLATDPGESLFYSLTYLRWPLFAAALAYWIFDDREALLLFGKAVLLTLLFIMFDTFWQFGFGSDIFGIEKFAPDRLTGPLRNPVVGNLSMRLFFIALFSLSLLELARHTRTQLAMIMLLLGTFFLFIYVTGERMSLVFALTTLSMVLCGLFIARPTQRLQLLLMSLAILGVVALFTAVHPQVFERSVTSLGASLADIGPDPYGRVFQAGWQVWLEHFWTGTGPHNYATACSALHENSGFDVCQRHPHNVYLHWLAETGIIGTGLFLLTLLALIRQSLVRALRAEAWFLSSCLLATLFIPFWPLASSASFFNNWFAAIIWCAVGWSLAAALHFTRATPDYKE